MDTWIPITAQELEALLERELSRCSDEQRQYFTRISTGLREAKIERFGLIENVFVVAQDKGIALYYEDVEEGFNLSPLTMDGAIASPGWEGWELHHALYHLAAQVS
ncbi:hypothetical protein [Pseudoxanthomonas sacheonensis]|uniref:Uncharacterized protein n=1 Tax=Pseudoxanthomonas sacheonensis TaxID=443615 RepID=A0ABU1RSK3_9GAMM|nr:hypothetical protein [Pseudoxanthomonas sacheonensis]MDR6841758.1 hypothetical protein [Pseudoxanthomonas sacheonensis]